MPREYQMFAKQSRVLVLRSENPKHGPAAVEADGHYPAWRHCRANQPIMIMKDV
jgi:hypothetical protein